MKKRRHFRPDALDGLEMRLAPSTMNPGTLLAHFATVDAKTHHGGHGGHHGHHGGSGQGGQSGHNGHKP